MQHLVHGTSGFDNPIWRETFPQEVFTGYGAIGKINIRYVIYYLPVRFLRHTLIKAAVSGFHMKDRNLSFLCRNCAETAVGIPQYQERVGLFRLQDGINGNQYTPYRFRCVLSGRFQKVIGLSDTQVLKKYLIEFIIVVLPRVYQYMFNRIGLIQPGDNAR